MKRRVDINEEVGEYLRLDGATPDVTILLYDIAESLQRIVVQLDIVISNQKG
jgi:hypothetical protein